MKILVVGGGVMGMACSWRLARAGASVQLLDAGLCGEQGASSAALGALWPPGVLNRHPLQMLHRESLWQFESFVRDVSHAAEMPVAFDRCGRIELLNSVKSIAHAEEEQEASMAEAESHGEKGPLQIVLSPEALRAALPRCADIRFGATLCHRTARVDVPALLSALLRACRRAGVAIGESLPVRRILPHAIETAEGTCTADAVLITAGAWTPTLLPAAPVVQAKGQAIALARPAHLDVPRIIKRGIHYIVPWGEELFVGATTENNAGFDRTPTAEARDRLRASAAAIFPELADAPVLRQWTGTRPDGPGHLPLMGPVPDLPGVYLCTGHYKTGVALAPIVSSLMAQQVVTGISPPEFDLFLPEKHWTPPPSPAHGKTASISSAN